MSQSPQNPVEYFTGRDPLGHPEPLTPEQLSQITHARARYKKVRRAISVAAADAWTTGFFAAISLLGSLMDRGVAGLLFGFGMAWVSYNSFRGLKALRENNPNGATLLAKNQLLCGLMLILYSLWCIYLIWMKKFDLGLTPDSTGELSEAGFGWIVDYLAYCYYGLYAAIILFALVAQSLTAWYYQSRRKYVEEYLSRTAEWVLQMQKMGFKL
jgi:hypothetical protein